MEATVKNLGIAIAVSEYTGELAKLPACTRDGSAIARVLQTESRFDDVLVIDSETISTSGAIKAHTKIRTSVFYA